MLPSAGIKVPSCKERLLGPMLTFRAAHPAEELGVLSVKALPRTVRVLWDSATQPWCRTLIQDGQGLS